MGEFNVTSSNLNNNYEYKDAAVMVVGGYNKDATTSTLQNVNGSVYNLNDKGEQSDYIGNFNGYMRDGAIKYSMSEMSRQDSMKVWNAIDGIEPHIIGTNNEE